MVVPRDRQRGVGSLKAEGVHRFVADAPDWRSCRAALMTRRGAGTMKRTRSAEPRGVARSATSEINAIVAWYFGKVYGRREGPGILPYYCDASRVGRFAVSPAALAAGKPAAVFHLLVTMGMYQARRDVLVMELQRRMPGGAVAELRSPATLRRLIRLSRCPHLTCAAGFDAGCDIHGSGLRVTCSSQPRLPCHVKRASERLRRMADMGKFPTSAWLHFWADNEFRRGLTDVFSLPIASTARAELLVRSFCGIYRVGRKLATMFVSALSTPSLAPGLTPWFPSVDGSELVVVDTNVARVVDVLARGSVPRTYQQRDGWIRTQARKIDLRAFRRDLPRYSPRLVQQAFFAFRSRSNRVANGTDCCADGSCADCAPRACPFSP